MESLSLPDDQPKRSVRAGEAFLRELKNAPDTEAEVVCERARERLQAFIQAMQLVIDSPEFREAKEEDRRALELRCFDRPDSQEDWEHIARIIELPPEKISAGRLTMREVFDSAIAWADRITIKRKLEAKAEQPDSQPGEIPALSRRQFLIVETFLEMNATSADALVTTAEVAERAEGKAADPVQFKADIAREKRGLHPNKKGTGWRLLVNQERPKPRPPAKG